MTKPFGVPVEFHICHAESDTSPKEANLGGPEQPSETRGADLADTNADKHDATLRHTVEKIKNELTLSD
jgi:hypothetical protein